MTNVPEETLGHVRGGRRLSPQTFLQVIQRTWPTLWLMCRQLSEKLRETGKRVNADISGFSKIHRLEVLHGMAGTAVRREIGRHFDCRFYMPHGSTVSATARDECESPPSTRIVNIIEHDLSFGFAQIQLLAKRAVESPDGFAVEELGMVSDVGRLEILRIHAIEPYRTALETMFGIQLAFHGPCVSAARRRGVPSIPFEAFVSIEEMILHSSAPSPRD